MPKLKVMSFSISLDGYGAGPNQSLENPLGVGGKALHEWAFPTRTFQRMFGNDGGTTGVDDDFATRGFQNIGAWILGRNMFGPVRGPWPDETWKGWWGDEPLPHSGVCVDASPAARYCNERPNHVPFRAEGIHAALQRASAAAGGKDIRVGGGVATIQQFLRAGLIEELHLAISPVVLGTGEHLFANINMRDLGYRCTERASTEKATHVVLSKQ